MRHKRFLCIALLFCCTVFFSILYRSHSGELSGSWVGVDTTARASFRSTEETDLVGAENEPASTDIVSFPHRTEFDADSKNIFIVRTRFSFSSLPKMGRRAKIVSKYDSRSTQPYPGWSIALRVLKSSVRPEVYWQDGTNQIGWYSFDKFDFRLGAVYDLTLVVKANEQMSLFLNEISAGKSDFFGGYSLTGTGFPKTETSLSFSIKASGPAVSRLIVAQKNPFDYQEKH